MIKQEETGRFFYMCTVCGAIMKLRDLESVATCPVCGTPDNYWNAEEE